MISDQCLSLPPVGDHIERMQDFLNWAYASAITIGGIVALSLIFWLIDKGRE
jgi:hypothetical protein